MFRALVGIVSAQGLDLLSHEGADSRRLMRRSLDGTRVGFWAFVPEPDANHVQNIFAVGRRHDALRLLDDTAKQVGRILPSDVFRESP